VNISIRVLTDQDGRAAGRIFFDAVHLGTTDVYSVDQRIAWAGAEFDPDRWADRLIGVQGFMAEADQKAIGFMTLDATGYIDLAFIDPLFLGKGVGTQLYAAIEGNALERNIERLSTHASEKAKPFFLKCGWHVEARQTAIKRGVELQNYRMFKDLT